MKRITFLLITVVCSLTVACSPRSLTDFAGSSAKTQEAPIRKIGFDNIRTGLVQVGVKEGPTDNEYKWLGTGFIVNLSCTYVTAKNVIKDANPEKLVVRFQIPESPEMERTLPARILYEDETKDIAFLRTDFFGGGPCKISRSHYYFLLSDKSHFVTLTGKEVLIAGYPSIGEHNDIPIVRQGIISSVEISWDKNPMILLDLQEVPGFSGSPVILKETGEVVGIAFGPDPATKAFDFEWATPLFQEDYRKMMEVTEGERNSRGAK